MKFAYTGDADTYKVYGRPYFKTEDGVSKASYDGINKELARKALVEYLDDVIGRLQKDIIVHRG